MTIHIDEIDITADGAVVVQGHVSAGNITVNIVPLAYVQAPADGIWEYELSETQHGPVGTTVMKPFSVTAPFPAFSEATGVRILVLRRDGPVAVFTRLNRNVTAP
jgi:hypothetical protein